MILRLQMSKTQLVVQLVGSRLTTCCLPHAACECDLMCTYIYDPGGQGG
jgi:hypothetical protein